MSEQSDLQAPVGRAGRRVAGEDGYVLIWALFAFVLLGGFAAAALKSTGSERRLAKASTEWNASFYAAEVGLQQALGVATDTLLGPLATGDSVDLGWLPIDGSTEYRAVIHRIDDGPHLMYRIRSTGRHNTLFGGETTVTQTVTTASDVPTGLVFNKGLTVSGNAKVYGGCRLHANHYLRVPGALLTDGPVSSGGPVEGNITSYTTTGDVAVAFGTTTDVNPTVESFVEPETPDPIDPAAFCSSADYRVENGQLIHANGSTAIGGSNTENWSVTNTTGVDVYTVNETSSVAFDGQPGMRAQGSFCVDGSLRINYSPGSAAAPEPLSVFATGFIELTGNPFVEAAHPSGVLFESLGDILLSAFGDPTVPNFRGDIRSRSHCDFQESPRVDGAVECFGDWEPSGVPNLVTADEITGDLELATPCNAAGVISARPIALRSWRHDY